jgi:pimeloyl-ACP methyl ester carboxylesterase
VYDTFGNADDPPLLLIMGLGTQMIGWDEVFCAQLASHGFWVIRFDNRDVGLSTRFDQAPPPGQWDFLKTFLLKKEMRQAPYLLSDMADDAAGLLDALSIESAHVAGISMGGMIAQTMAINHPRHVRTLTSIMSSPGVQELPRPSLRVAWLLIKQAPADLAGYVEETVKGSRVLNGPGFPLDEARLRQLAEMAYQRGRNPAGAARHLAAILASGSREAALRQVKVPTLVIHGDADPLVPLLGGLATARAIPGAQMKVIKGLGHGLPPGAWLQLIEAISGHCTA